MGGGGGTYSRQGTYLGQGVCFFFDKQTKCSKQNFNIYLKGNNNKDCNMREF